MSSKYPHKRHPTIDTLLIKIWTWNFQDIILGGYLVHPWHKKWPWPLSLLSGTLNIFWVSTWRTQCSWHTSDNYKKSKHSGSDPWVFLVLPDIKDDPILQISSQEHSVSFKYTHSWFPILDNLIIKISPRKGQYKTSWISFMRSNKVIYDIMCNLDLNPVFPGIFEVAN